MISIATARPATISWRGPKLGYCRQAQIAKLPNRLAFDHVARTAVQHGGFDDERIYPVLGDLALRSSSPTPTGGFFPRPCGRSCWSRPGAGALRRFRRTSPATGCRMRCLLGGSSVRRAFADTVPARKDTRLAISRPCRAMTSARWCRASRLRASAITRRCATIDRRLATLLDRGFQAAGSRRHRCAANGRGLRRRVCGASGALLGQAIGGQASRPRADRFACRVVGACPTPAAAFRSAPRPRSAKNSAVSDRNGTPCASSE